MDSVVLLMSVSAGHWHRGGMTMIGGAVRVPSRPTVPSHVPIVIGTSSEFPLPGWVERVVYAAVMVLLLVTARSTRLAVAAARTGAAPIDIGRLA